MEDWHQVLVGKETSIKEVIKVIDLSGVGIALVSESGKLLGTVTDGDVRRGILNNIDLNTAVEKIMNANPLVGKVGDTPASILANLKRNSIQHLPILDSAYYIKGLETLDQFVSTTKRDNQVVIMAGGKGLRLRPLTQNCPKPLLKIDSQKPMLEIILEQMIEYGFHDFYFSLHYRAQMIKDYFKDGTKWGVSICYLEESEPLGTAGALSLLPHQNDLPIIVMNGDIMTQINFNHLLNFHAENKDDASVCVREYQHSIPYGVVKLAQQKLVSLEEKPIHCFFVNAGIYVLSPNILKLLSKDTPCNMPALLEECMAKKMQVSAFPIREYWLDIGRMEDFQQAHTDYQNLFIRETDERA